MKKLARIVVLLLLATALWYGWTWWESYRQAEAVDLVLYGNVEIHEVDLAFRVPGRIEELFVREGDVVKPGEKLARLDSRPFDDDVLLAKADVAMQAASLDKLQKGFRSEDVEQARAALREREATLENTRISLQRLEALRKSGAIAQQSLDDGRARMAEAEARRNAARDQLNLMLQGYQEQDIAVQKAALEAAQARLAKARTALDDTLLLAPEQATVLTRVREKGAIVQTGQVVYTMALTDPVYIRAFVPQPRLGLIKPGQQVLLEVDAMPGKRYPGVVGFISARAEFTPKSVETRQVRNDLVFRIRILALDPDNVLRQGMPVTIIIPDTAHNQGHGLR